MTALLLSYPRSGNHLVRFVAEYISGRPTKGCMHNPEDVPICRNVFPKPVLAHVQPTAEPVFQKSHGFPECAAGADRKMVFILRDYRECITRQVLMQPKRNALLNRLAAKVAKPPGPGKYFGCLASYLEVLRIYDGWQEPKHLIYYEDLITDFEATVRKLAAFMHWDQSRVDEFAWRKDELFAMSLQGEGRSWAGSKTKGKSVRAHFSDADPKMLALMATHIEKFHQDLTPYLTPYGIAESRAAHRVSELNILRSATPSYPAGDSYAG